MGIATLLQSFSEKDWQMVQGLSSLILISAGGTSNYDFALAGQVNETLLLKNAPLLKELLMTLQRPLSRCRVIRLPRGEHSLYEASFHRFSRQLIYIPLSQCSQTQFYIENKLVPLSLNEPYQLSGTKTHKITNHTDTDCVYLQIETLHSMSKENASFLETHHFQVLTPTQLQDLISVIVDAINKSSLEIDKQKLLQQKLHLLTCDWENAFNRFQQTWAGELSYQDIVLDLASLFNENYKYLNENARHASTIIQTVLSTNNDKKTKRHFSRYFFASNQPLPDLAQCPEFKQPIFIISAPRAGSTLLFETLAKFPDVWTIGEESHELIEDIPSLHPSSQNFESNALSEFHATKDVVQTLKQRFVRQLRNRNREDYLKLDAASRPNVIRFLEKTPKNVLRIPFLKTVFPDAKFIYLHRESKDNISSLLEGWRSLRFVAYRNLQNWAHRQWSFVLPHGWRELHSASLIEIAAYQWRACNETIETDLKKIPKSDWFKISYSDLVLHPKETLMQIAHFAELDKDCNIEDLLSQTLPISRLTLSPPSVDKWRKYELELETVTTER